MERGVQIRHKQYRGGIHTAYVGDPSASKDEGGQSTRLVQQPFLRGRADKVATENRELLKKAGLI